MIHQDDAVTEVLDKEPHESRRGESRGSRLVSRMVDGVPHVHAVPLVPMRVGPGGEHLITSPTGLYAGVLVRQETTITFAPIPTPMMQFPRAIMRVEFANYDPDEVSRDDTPCILHVIYPDRCGKIHAEYSPPLIAEGERWGLNIPASAFRRGYAMPLALKVTPLESLRPVLVQGAWIEFPGMRHPIE